MIYTEPNMMVADHRFSKRALPLIVGVSVCFVVALRLVFVAVGHSLLLLARRRPPAAHTPHDGRENNDRCARVRLRANAQAQKKDWLAPHLVGVRSGLVLKRAAVDRIAAVRDASVGRALLRDVGELAAVDVADAHCRRRARVGCDAKSRKTNETQTTDALAGARTGFVLAQKRCIWSMFGRLHHDSRVNAVSRRAARDGVKTELRNLLLEPLRSALVELSHRLALWQSVGC